jgi:hypothetical protein
MVFSLMRRIEVINWNFDIENKEKMKSDFVGERDVQSLISFDAHPSTSKASNPRS